MGGKTSSYTYHEEVAEEIFINIGGKGFRNPKRVKLLCFPLGVRKKGETLKGEGLTLLTL